MSNENSKMHISQLPIIICTILYCTSFIINDLGLSITIYAGAIAVTSVVIVFLTEVYRGAIIQRDILPMFLMFIIVIFTSFNHYDLADNTKTFYIIISILSLVTFAMTPYNNKTVSTVNRIVSITGIFFATFIYWFKISPIAVKSMVYPLVTPETISDIEFITNQGYGFFFHGDISYTLVIILFAIFIALFSHPKTPRIVIAIYLIGALLLSQRRTEIVFGLVTIGIMYLFVFFDIVKEFIKKHRTLFLVFFATLITIIVYFIVWYCNVDYSYSSDNRILMTLHDLKFKVDTSNGRSIIQEIALKLLNDNWFMGIGWMNFSQYGKLSGISMVRNVHNIYIQLILECGLILGIVFVISILIIVKRSIKRVKCYNLSGAGVAMLLYILLGGLTDNTIYYQYFWIIMGISVYFSGFSMGDLAIEQQEN